MTRAEVNELILSTNQKLADAGKMFRVRTYNLVEEKCIYCEDNMAIVEQGQTPICGECYEDMIYHSIEEY